MNMNKNKRIRNWRATRHSILGSIQKGFLGIREILEVYLGNMGMQTPGGIFRVNSNTDNLELRRTKLCFL